MNLDDALVFTSLFTGSFKPSDVDILWQPKPLELPAAMNNEIEQHWKKTPKENIFNGALARLDHWASTTVSCRFVLRPSDYRTLLYSNENASRIKEIWGFEYLSRALGISAVTISADDQLLFMKRSSNVGECPNCFDVFGGHVDVPDNGAPCIFEAMEQELQEEMNLEPKDYDLTLIGLVETTVTHKPEAIFLAKIDKTAKEIANMAEKSKDNIEFSNIYSILNNYQSISKYLKENGADFSPSAIGSLCVYMQTNFTVQDREGKRGNER